ncbi:MAG: hypothetical protein ACOYOF_20385 [Verrucomicrobiaceae bacterium]
MSYHLPRRLACLTALTLLLSHCDDGSAARIKSLRDEIEQMNQQSFDASQQVKRLQSQIESAKDEKKKLEAEKAEAEQTAAETQKKLEQLQRDFDTYKSSYKLSMQRRAPGMKIDDFSTVEGKKYSNIVLRELTDTYVNFSHDAGIIKLTAAQLPETVQALLGFLNKRFEDPKDVKMLTVRQTNLQRQAEHTEKVESMEEAIKTVREEREHALRETGAIKTQIREAIASGKQVPTALTIAAEQGDLQLRVLANRIMQMEVEFHGLRRNPPTDLKVK